MSEEKMQKYSGWKVRSVWDDVREEWWFSVVDVVGVLTEQPDIRHAAKYWSVLKTRLKEEGAELTTNCSQLKMTSADGKKYKTDAMTVEQILRLVQSIPSKKAEPFKVFEEHREIAKSGGEAAGIARKAVEERTGRKVITSDNAERLNPMKDLIEGLIEGDLENE